MAQDRIHDYSARDRREWNNRIARMKREQKRARRRQRLLLIAGVAIVLIIAVIIAEGVIHKRDAKDKDTVLDQSVSIDATGHGGITIPQDDIGSAEEEDEEDQKPKRVKNTKHYSYTEADTVAFLSGENMTSSNAILVDVDNELIVGSVDYKARIIPASMTKVLTLLVAVENLDDLSKKVPVSIEATDYSYSKRLSAVGFAVDEEVTLEDLCYGTILCSGADAAAELAIQTAGSMEAFVDMMNDKVEELGLSGTTHFCNVSGSFDEDHYSTCYDLAVIMNAAMDDEYCRQVLSAHTYTTSKSEAHPDGITISNWFLRRIEDKDTGGEVIGAKTGYVVQSGNCGVSYYTSNSGRNYICVTADAHSAWRCIYDHVDVYKNHTQ